MRDGEIVVYLSVDVTPGSLRRTTLHECKHVSDYVTGAYRQFSHAELEKRADEFAFHVLQVDPGLRWS